MTFGLQPVPSPHSATTPLTLFLFGCAGVFAANQLSLVVMKRGSHSLQCVQASHWSGILIYWSTGSRVPGLPVRINVRPRKTKFRGSRSSGSIVVAHRLTFVAACGIFLDQKLNLCLHKAPRHSPPFQVLAFHQPSTGKASSSRGIRSTGRRRSWLGLRPRLAEG